MTSDEIVEYLVKTIDNPNIAGLIIRANWKECVSNSHSAPRSKEQNFLRNPDKPLGFPGWEGKVWVITHGQLGSDILRYYRNESSGIRNGTGGYGLYSGDNLESWQKAMI